MAQIARYLSLLKYSTHVCAGFDEARFYIAAMVQPNNAIVKLKGKGNYAPPLDFSWKQDGVKCSGRIEDASALCAALEKTNSTCSGTWDSPYALVTDSKQLYHDTSGNGSWKLLSLNSTKPTNLKAAAALRFRKGACCRWLPCLTCHSQPITTRASCLCLSPGCWPSWPHPHDACCSTDQRFNLCGTQGSAVPWPR